MNQYNLKIGDILRIKVLVENTGSVPAEDVYANIVLPEEIDEVAYGSDALSTFLDDQPDPPKPPSSSIFGLDSLYGHDQLRNRCIPESPNIRLRDEPDCGVARGVNGEFEIQISIPRLLHHKPIEFGDFFLRYRSDVPARPFQSNFRLTAGNISEVLTGTLNCIASREEGCNAG